MVGNMYQYRAIKRENKWILQNRTLVFLWKDVRVRNLLMSGKTYLHLLLTLHTTLEYGKVCGVDVINKGPNKVVFVERVCPKK